MFRTMFVALMTASVLSLTASVFAADQKKSDDPAADADAAKRHGELFDKLDANHDGFITADEVPADHKRLFDRLVRRSDKTADGKLSRDEFISGMAEDRTKDRPFAGVGPRAEGGPGEGPPEGGPGGPRMMMGGPLFRALDTNHDGKIDVKEIEAASESLKKISKNGEITRDDLMEAARRSSGQGRRADLAGRKSIPKKPPSTCSNGWIRTATAKCRKTNCRSAGRKISTASTPITTACWTKRNSRPQFRR